uniref:Transposase n=1 Tax=Ascaris lumbricoides TaxID=6252 RepID=A0A0M3HZX8_ASCLU
MHPGMLRKRKRNIHASRQYSTEVVTARRCLAVKRSGLELDCWSTHHRVTATARLHRRNALSRARARNRTHAQVTSRRE